MVFDDMLSIAWGVLEFVVSYVFILCMAAFVGIIAWTIVEKARQLVKMGAPGWSKLIKKRS